MHLPYKVSIRLRLHTLSWLVLLLSTVTLTLIIIPAIPGYRPVLQRQTGYDIYGHWSDGSSPRLFRVTSWSHGWPFEYLSRPYDASSYLLEFNSRPVQWSSRAAWPSLGPSYYFSLPLFLADLTIALLIVLASVTICEIWRRRRAPGALRISLLDLAFFITFLCLALAWYASHQRTRTRERAIFDRLQSPGALSGLSPLGTTSTNWHYRGPQWLERLVGNPQLLEACIHLDSITLDSRPLSNRDHADLRLLTHLASIGCYRTLTPELVDSLSTLPHLRVFDAAPASFSGADPLPRFTSSAVKLLPRLPQLTTLDLGRSQLVPADLDVLARLPALKTLQFVAPDLLVEDLSRLDASPHLQTLILQITATHTELEAFQATHPRYRLIYDPRTPVGPWQVARVHITRWGGQPRNTYPGTLNLTHVHLTSSRLARLASILPSVDHLTLGPADSPHVALDLILCCRPLQYLDVRHIPFTKSQLDQIPFSSHQFPELQLQQGPLSLQQLTQFLQQHRPTTLTLHDTTLTDDQAASLQDACLDTYLEFHRQVIHQ